MEQFINEAAFYLIKYLYNELIEIIYSYLVKFNTESLAGNLFSISGNFDIYKINVYKNKIYLPTYADKIIIIYDMKTHKISQLNTNLRGINSICNIDENNIIVGTINGLYFLNYDIIDEEKFVINSNKEVKNNAIYDIIYFDNKIICLSLLYVSIFYFENNFLKVDFYEKCNCLCDSTFLYNGHVYIYRSKENLIDVINIKNVKNRKIISLSHKNPSRVISSTFVDDTCIYIYVGKNINIFDHDGELIRKIKINIPNLNSSFYIDSDKIYLTQKLENSTNFLVLQQKLKYKYKNTNFDII